MNSRTSMQSAFPAPLTMPYNHPVSEQFGVNSVSGTSAELSYEADLRGYVDSILPESFQPYFEDDHEVRQSLDLNLGAASMWSDDSRSDLDADFDGSGTRYASSHENATTLPPSLFDLLDDEDTVEVTDASPKSRKGYHHREKRLYLNDEQLKRDRTRILNNKASKISRKMKKKKESENEGNLPRLEQKNDQLRKRCQLLEQYSDWCHDVFEKYHQYYDGSFGDIL